MRKNLTDKIELANPWRRYGSSPPDDPAVMDFQGLDQRRQSDPPPPKPKNHQTHQQAPQQATTSEEHSPEYPLYNRPELGDTGHLFSDEEKSGFK